MLHGTNVLIIYRMFQKVLYSFESLYNFIQRTYTVERWIVCTPLSLNVFVNIRHTVAFGIPL
jgi:hypothetical protein